MNCSTLGFPVLRYLLEFAQTHVHWVSDAIHPSYPLSVGSSYHVVKVLELQLQPQSFQWIFRIISFRIHWLDLLTVQGTLRTLLQHHSSKASILWCLAFFAMILVFWMLSFKPTFSLSSFTFIKRLLSSSSLSAIRVVSSAYLGLLIFLPASWFQLVLLPAQHFSWCTLHIS